jgi:hypothetical protein
MIILEMILILHMIILIDIASLYLVLMGIDLVIDIIDYFRNV